MKQLKQMKGLKCQGGWVQYAVAGVSALGSILGGKSGAESAKRIGRENAALIAMETTETLRRMELTQEQLVGEANVRASGSGFTKEGSIAKYFEDLEGEYQNQVDWTKRAGAQRQKIAIAGGGAAADTIKAGAIQGVFSAASNAVGWYNT
jgi:hypothetical protein